MVLEWKEDGHYRAIDLVVTVYKYLLEVAHARQKELCSASEAQCSERSAFNATSIIWFTFIVPRQSSIPILRSLLVSDHCQVGAHWRSGVECVSHRP